MTQRFEQLEDVFGIDTVAEMRKEVESIEIKWSPSLDIDDTVVQNQ